MQKRRKMVSEAKTGEGLRRAIQDVGGPPVVMRVISHGGKTPGDLRVFVHTPDQIYDGVSWVLEEAKGEFSSSRVQIKRLKDSPLQS